MSTPTITSDRPAPDRKAAYRALTDLMVLLPAPEALNFDARPENSTYLKIYLANGADFDAWVAALGATAWKRNELVGSHLQCHANGVDWRGWHVYLSACYDPALAEVAAR